MNAVEAIALTEVEQAYEDALANAIAKRENIIDQPATEDDEIRESLEVQTEILRLAYSEHKTWGYVVLKVLWNVAQLPYETVYQVRSLMEYATQVLGINSEEIEYHIHIVERILLPMESAPVRFTRPDTGEIVTTETLVNTPKLLSKLKIISPHFKEAMQKNDTDKAKNLIGLVLTESNTRVASLVRWKPSVEKPKPIQVQVKRVETSEGVRYALSGLLDEEELFSLKMKNRDFVVFIEGGT